MAPRHVEVGADEDLVAVGWQRHFVKAARVVAVLALQDVDNLLDFGLVIPRLAGTPGDREAGGVRPPAEVEIGEEKGPVAHDRSADAEASLLVFERTNLRVDGGWGGPGCDARDLADEMLVSPEPVGGAAVAVRAASGDGVDAAAGEASLADVVRRHDDLDLLNGVEADRLGRRLSARRAAGRYPEHVVVDCAVDLHVVVAVVAPCDAHVLIVAGGVLRDVHKRRRPGEVEEASLNRGQRLDCVLPDVGGCAGAAHVDQRRLGRDDDGFRHRRQRHLELNRPIFAERDVKAALVLILEAAERRRYGIGAPHSDVRDLKAPLTICIEFRDHCARRDFHHPNPGQCQRGIRMIFDNFARKGRTFRHAGEKNK